jgi:carbamoyl-phosphate synthase/aspartate carbamoyltransferase/dihydroorotase
MLTAVRQGRLSLERLVELMSTRPRQLFGLPEQPQTFVEVDVEARTVISNERLHTRCGWTPFAGMTVCGQVRRVVLRGEVAYDVDSFAAPGTGRLLP